jgi:hypothetical protein
MKPPRMPQTAKPPTGLCPDSFPHFGSMDGNAGIHLEAQFHVGTANIEHRNFQYVRETVGLAHDHRLLALSR